MFATLMIVGSSGAATQTAWGLQRAGDAADDDRLLLAVLGRAQELLAEVVVDGGVGGAAGGAGQGDGLGSVAVAADQQLWRGGDEGGVAAAGAEDVTGWKPARRTPKTAAASWAVGAWTVTSRASTIFSKSPALMRSTARRRRPRSAQAVRRSRSGSGPTAPGRAAASGVEAQRRRTRVQPRGDRLGQVVRRGQGRQRQPNIVAAARKDTSGTTRSAAEKPDQCGACPPSGAKANPPTATRPAPGGPSGASATASAASARHSRDTRAKRSAPRRGQPRRRRPSTPARTRRGRAARSRTSPRPPRGRRRRPRSGRRQTPPAWSARARTGRPLRRARRTARAQRRSSSPPIDRDPATRCELPDRHRHTGYEGDGREAS